MGGQAEGRGGFIPECASVLLTVGGSDSELESVLLALFAPELSASEIQAFLMREESAHVYTLCRPVASLFAKPLFMGVHKHVQLIYCCVFMTTSRKEDCHHYFLLWKVKLSAVLK